MHLWDFMLTRVCSYLYSNIPQIIVLSRNDWTLRPEPCPPRRSIGHRGAHSQGRDRHFWTQQRQQSTLIQMAECVYDSWSFEHCSMNSYNSTVPRATNFLKFMYSSKTSWSISFKYFWVKNGVFSNFVGYQCGKPSIFGAVFVYYG